MFGSDAIYGSDGEGYVAVGETRSIATKHIGFLRRVSPRGLSGNDMVATLGNRNCDRDRLSRACALIVVGLLVASCSGASKGLAKQSERTPPPSATTTNTTLASVPATTTTLPSTASVIGGLNGTPPCASGDEGAYGADVAHPERAPLQATATFPGGIRWAICGASISFGSDLLNLRSANDGRTWTVTKTGFGMSPHHAGDNINVALTNPSVGRVRLRSRVADFDDTYSTTDGGTVWQQTCALSQC